MSTTNSATTLKDAVTRRIKLTLKMDGIDAAKKKLDAMAMEFSFAPDWPDIYNEAMTFLLEQKRQADQAEAEHKKKMEKAWMKAVLEGAKSGQFNLLTGNEAKALFYPPTMGGHKE